ITALAGQMMGSHMVILESGSGAPSCVPENIVALVRKTVEIPIVVAGGVKTPEIAYKTIKAGADIVHVGTALDLVSSDPKKAKALMQEFVKSVKKAGKEKLQKK
ncbi:MAG: geranylgeranylglyceryl/heptaprenylglyceryl phosphate synthase, partial [Candidatus Diapherotrites archaeon]|nr:geranylgeranylglyceryl/heptaprenylglyceryl phosphate synthase [Candidatus Diapherotrites archaeon]